jgi:hypothetical protein
VLDDGNVEAPEMEDLGHLGIGQERLEVGRRIVAAELHQMTIAIASRELQQAEAIAQRVEAHGLAVDGYALAEVEPGRQVADMQLVGQANSPDFSRSAGGRGILVTDLPLSSASTASDRRPGRLCGPPIAAIGTRIRRRDGRWTATPWTASNTARWTGTDTS